MDGNTPNVDENSQEAPPAAEGESSLALPSGKFQALDNPTNYFNKTLRQSGIRDRRKLDKLHQVLLNVCDQVKA